MKRKKYIIPTVDILKQFMKGGVFELKLIYEPIDSNKKSIALSKIKLKKNQHKKGFDFTITPKKFLNAKGILHSDSYGLTDEIVLKNKNTNRELSIEKHSIQNTKVLFNKSHQVISGTFANLKTGLSIKYEDAYWRLIVPVNMPNTDIVYPGEVINCYKNSLSFDNKAWDKQNTMLGLKLQTVKGFYSNVIINSNSFHFYLIEDLNVLFIDSTSKLPYSEFKRISNIIRGTFGFLTGRYYRNEAYYVSSMGKNFEKIKNVCYETEESLINTKKEIVNPTLFFSDFDGRSKEFQEKNKKYRSFISEIIFSKLCDEMYHNEVLHRVIEIILSAVSANSPLEQGALYSVALETMTNFIKSKNPESVKIIQDSKIWDTIREELIKGLNNKSNQLKCEEKEILTNKIKNLNQATNRSKLLIPFQLYNILLSETDKETLDNRNKFLHGESPIDINERFELEVIGLKIHFLLACLILKYVGYEGHVVNIPVWHYFGNKDKVTEIMNKLNIDGLLSFSEIEKTVKNGNIKKAEIETARLIDALKAGEKVSNPFKII